MLVLLVSSRDESTSRVQCTELSEDGYTASLHCTNKRSNARMFGTKQTTQPNFFSHIMCSLPSFFFFDYLCAPFLMSRPTLRLLPRSPTLYSSTTIPSTSPVLPSGARAMRPLLDSFVMPKSSMAVCEFSFGRYIFLFRCKSSGRHAHACNSLASVHLACVLLVLPILFARMSFMLSMCYMASHCHSATGGYIDTSWPASSCM